MCLKLVIPLCAFKWVFLNICPVLRVEEITEVIPVRKGWKRRMLEVTSQLLHISAKQKLCFIIFVAQAFPLEAVLVRIVCVCV